MRLGSGSDNRLERRPARRLCAAAAALLLCAAAGAQAQETNSSAGSGNAGTGVIGPPQLKDFSLTPRERIVTQPAPVAPEPAPAEPAPRAAPPTQTPPPPQQPRVEPAPERAAPAPVPAERDAAPESVASPPPPPVMQTPQPQPQPLPAPMAAEPLPVETAPVEEPSASTPLWYFLLPAALLALLGGAFLLRRRREAAVAAGEPEAAPPAAPAAAPPAARPKPVIDAAPRAWLEIEMKAQRASATADEAVVDFELSIRNTGKADARNVRITARMFNAGAEQDRELGEFFTSRGEGRRSFTLPKIPAGVDGRISGSVTMTREEMRGLRVQERLLFIPVVGVNAVYDYGEDRTGQTSKSYIVGRELGETQQKMGPFRLDLGPRVYRTVGQRQHRLARRV